MIPVLIIAALMGAEAVGVFFVAKAISPVPEPALAAGADGGELGAGDVEPDELAEIELVDSRPSNMMAGKLVTFHIRVSVLVALADLEKAERLTRLKRARLEDGVNTVIRSAEPKHFYEPDLQTIRRRLKYELDRIFGDEHLVKKVLIPHLLQSGRGV
jgi:hypothetical protein